MALDKGNIFSEQLISKLPTTTTFSVAPERAGMSRKSLWIDRPSVTEMDRGGAYGMERQSSKKMEMPLKLITFS